MTAGEASKVLGRVSAGLLGSYAFTWCFAALGIAALVALGVDFHEAETGVRLLAFLVFLGVFLWAFAAASLARVWAVLGGGRIQASCTIWLRTASTSAKRASGMRLIGCAAPPRRRQSKDLGWWQRT